MLLSECSISCHDLVYQLPSDHCGLMVRDGEALKPFREIAPHHQAVLVPHRGDGIWLSHVPVVSSASCSRIRCRSCSCQLASLASKNLVPPARECTPCPDGPHRSSMKTLENDVVPVLRNDQLGPPSLSLQFMEPTVQYSSYQI